MPVKPHWQQLALVENRQRQLLKAGERQRKARQSLREAVLEARKDHTLAEIGKVLGTSRQGVYDLLNR